MNDIDELKQFVVAQARSQTIARDQYQEVLDRIRTDEDGTPGSWAREWSDTAEQLEREGRLLEAGQYYTMARFPYPDGDARRHALAKAQQVFARRILPAIPAARRDALEILALPSTSPANASIPRDVKLDRWRVLLQFSIPRTPTRRRTQGGARMRRTP